MSKESSLRGYNAFSVYMAIRSHFKTSYDYFKYNGKTNVNHLTYSRRKDKYYFRIIEKRYQNTQLVNFYVSNIVYNPEFYPKALVGTASKETYLNWKTTMQSFYYHFESDLRLLSSLSESNKKIFYERSGRYPLIIKKYLAKEIKFETVVATEAILSYIKKVDNDPIINSILDLTRNYSPFILKNLNQKNIKKSLYNVLSG